MDRENQRIVLIESSPRLIRGLVEVLQETDDLKVAGTARDADASYQVVLREKPDLVIINMVVGGRGEFVLADDLSGRVPGTQLAFLSSELLI